MEDLIITGKGGSMKVAPKENQVLRDNFLQLHEMELYAAQTGKPFEEAAMEWIRLNSEYWRKKHNTM